MEIPVYRENQVEPTVLPTPRMPGDSPAGQALEGAGKTLEGVAGQAFDLAREERIKANASVVMDAYVNVSKKALNLKNDALSKKGKDALVFDKYLSDYDEFYNSVKVNLTPEQQSLLDMRAAHEKLSFETTLHRHAREQSTALNNANAKALVDIEEQKLAVNYRVPSDFDIKNPASQINKFRASVADQLNMNGIHDTEPAFKDAMDKATSRAYADRIKLLMNENPKEAKHFLEVHQDEMEPHELERLKKEVAHLEAEQNGIGAAMSYLDDIKTGKKSETDITKELYEKFKDDPTTFKIAQAELNHLYTQNRADQVASTVSIAGSLEAKIDEATAKGQGASVAFLKNTDEYKQLSQMAADGNKAAATELSKVRSYAAKVQREETRLVKQQQSLNRQFFMLKIGDPQTLPKMSKEEIYNQGRDAGLSINQIKQVWGEHDKLVKESMTPAQMHNNNISTDMVNRVLDKANIPKDQREGFSQAWRGAIKAEETRLGHPMSAKEIEEAGIMGIQRHATTFLGITTGHKWEKPEGAPQKATTYPTDFTDRVTAVEKKRGVRVTDQQRQALYEEYKKESGDKRADGTQKGPGFLGTLKRPDGKVSTELSIGVNIDGKETEIPTLVPTLTEEEREHLINGGGVTERIAKKAVAHAKKRIAEGKSPFKEANE